MAKDAKKVKNKKQRFLQGQSVFAQMFRMIFFGKDGAKVQQFQPCGSGENQVTDVSKKSHRMVGRNQKE